MLCQTRPEGSVPQGASRPCKTQRCSAPARAGCTARRAWPRTRREEKGRSAGTASGRGLDMTSFESEATAAARVEREHRSSWRGVSLGRSDRSAIRPDRGCPRREDSARVFRINTAADRHLGFGVDVGATTPTSPTFGRARCVRRGLCCTAREACQVRRDTPSHPGGPGALGPTLWRRSGALKSSSTSSGLGTLDGEWGRPLTAPGNFLQPE